jgi:hypothetical protein
VKDLHMTSSRFWRFVSGGLVLVLVLMPFHAFISTLLGTAIGPLWLWKSWKEFFLVGLTLATLVWLARHHKLREVFTDPLVLLLCTYAIIVLGLTFIHRGNANASAAGLAMDLRYLVIFGLGYMLARYAPGIRTGWLKKAPRLLIMAGLLLALLGVLQVTVTPLDFLARFGYDKDKTIAPYELIDMNPEAPRAFATLRGPNDYGAYLILPLVIVLAYLIKIRDKILLGVALTAGIAVSASRSAWIAAIAAIATGILDAKRVVTKRMMLLGSIGIVALLLGLVAAVSIPSVRLAVFHSSPGDSSLTEGSTDKHWQATMAGIDRVIADPVGCGAGCAGPASFYGNKPRISENYYVQVAETYGVLGLVVWLGIFGLVMYKLWRHDEKLSTVLFASGVGYALIGFWLHVWSDDPLSLTWWCLVGIVLGVSASKNSASQLK